MEELKLIVLDVDGVLRDSSKVFYKCTKNGLQYVGLGDEFSKCFSVKDIWHFKGLGRFNNKRDALKAIYIMIKLGKLKGIHKIIYKTNAEQIIAKIVDSSNIKLDEKTLDGMVEEYKKVAMSKGIESHVKIYPGIEKIIKSLKAKKRIAIFTNSDIVIVRRDLKGLLDYFDYVITPKDVGASKPSGLGLKYIAKKSKIDPKNILYVGDTVVDIRTSKDAGCVCAVVLNGMGLKQHLEKENPDLVFKDIKEASKWILKN